MSLQASISLSVGILFLSLTVINGFYSPVITPSFQRAEIIAAISSISLMLVAFLWTQATPNPPSRKLSSKPQVFFIDRSLNDQIQRELAWGSHQILTATPAATVLIFFNQRVVLHRGLGGKGEFTPGSIANRARESGQLISLVNTTLFPGRKEFDSIVEGLPSVIIYPLSDKGWVITGGWSERCFSQSDEKWIKGWSDRLCELL